MINVVRTGGGIHSTCGRGITINIEMQCGRGRAFDKRYKRDFKDFYRQTGSQTRPLVRQVSCSSYSNKRKWSSGKRCQIKMTPTQCLALISTLGRLCSTCRAQSAKQSDCGPEVVYKYVGRLEYEWPNRTVENRGLIQLENNLHKRSI